MKKLFSSSDETSTTLGTHSEFLEELRESFTGSFAYDLFDWPALPGSESVTFNPPRFAAASNEGDRGHSETDDPVSLYTSNADIPVYLTGEVVVVRGAGAVVPQTDLSGPLVGVDDFRVDARFAGIDGSGYTIAVLDTGIDLDDPFFGPDLNNDGISDRIVYQYDFADGDSNASDFDGHGSNVSSIAASSDATYTGMAPGANIAALKVFGDDGQSGDFGDIEAALQWVIANAEAYNIVSVNMSLGNYANYDVPVQLFGIGDEMSTLAAMDVIVVTSSGNNFFPFNSVQGVSYPAADPNSLSVGAVYTGDSGGWQYQSGATAYTTTADQITPFSQRDAELTDIFAPGAPITGAGAGEELIQIHGTSQAAPHIAGIVALAQDLAVQEIGRKLSFDEIQALLDGTGDTIIDGDDEDDNVNNTGLAFQRVNVLALGEAILDLAAPEGERDPTYFQVSALDKSQAEGDGGSTGYSFLITRSGDLSEADSVDYSVVGSGISAADGADFLVGGLPAGSVIFDVGETSKVVTIQVAGDIEVEEDETFELTINSVPPNGQVVLPSDKATIENDDDAGGGGGGGGGGEPVVLLQADFNGSGDTGGFVYRDDLFGGDNARYADGDWENQALTVTLGGINNSVITDMTGGWETSITLDQDLEVSISFLYEMIMEEQYEADEYSQVLVSIDGGTPIVVAEMAGNGNGGPNETTGLQTFMASLGTLAAGDHTLAIGLYNSKKTWRDESSYLTIDDVTVTGTAPAAATTAATTIDSFFAIAAEDAVKAEGDAGTTAYSFTVTRSGNTSGADSVDYAVTGSGINAGDFVGGVIPSGGLAFAAGETSKTITIQVAGDIAIESDEGFGVVLSNPSAGASITTAGAVGIILDDDNSASAASSYAIAALDAVKAEGDSGLTDFTFTVTRSGDASKAGLVSYEVTAGDTDAGDFAHGILPHGALFFYVGETSKTITVQAAGDVALEGNEDFSVTLFDALGGAEISTASATGTISGDDAAILAVGPSEVAQAEGDGGATNFTFTVTRSGNTSLSGSVNYSVGGSEADGTDFLGGALPNGTLSFAAGQTSKTLTVQVAGDTELEPTEHFTVSLSNPSNGFEIDTAAATGTILNDDSSRGTTYFFASAYDAAKPEGTGGTTDFTFLVTRSGDTTAPDTIDYAVTGSGSNPANASDFAGGVLPSGSVTFATGETAKYVTIQVAADSTVESEEYFTLTISNPPPNGQIQTASDEATIENDDFPPGGPFVLLDADFNGTAAGTEGFSYVEGVFGGTTDPALTRGSWTAADITVVLGGGGSTQGTMTGGWERSFTLDQEMDLSLSFLYDIFHSRHFEADEYTQVLVRIDGGTPIVIDQIAGDAANTTDYIVDPTTAELDLGTFGAGDHTIVIGGLLNKMDGPDEYNNIGIDDVLLIGSIPTGPATFFSIAVGDAVKAEGDAGATAFTFAVTRSGDTTGADSVDWAVGGADVDAVDFGGSLPGGTVSFAAGETSKTVTVDVAGDSDFEADEDFTVTLTNPSAGSEITTASAGGTILNDDPAPPSTLYTISPLDADKAEGDAGTTLFSFTISRSGDLSLPATIHYNLAGYGAEPADGIDFDSGLFVLNTATFAVGESSVTINIRVTGDVNFEADESFIVTIFDPTNGGAVVDGSDSAIGTIVNDDPVPVTGSFSIAAEDAVKTEGDLGNTTLTFLVTRSGDASASASIDYAMTSGGPNGDDFLAGVLPSGTLTFAGGENSQVLSIEVAGDTVVEPDESFVITLSNPSAGSDITQATAVGTILNDDAPPPVTFYAIASTDAVKTEGDAGTTPFTFEITRSGITNYSSSVDYAVSGPGVDGLDFPGGVLPSGTVNFVPGELSKTITIDVAGDTNFEGDETFTVTLSNASGDSAITTASAGGTILNDDAAPPVTFLAIAAGDAAKAEGDAGTTAFTFTVTRSGDTSGAGSVDWAVSGAAVDGADFGGSLPGGTVSFAAGEVSKTVTVDVAGDADFEADEAFTVTLSNASAGSEITTASAGGTILNDDTPPSGPVTVIDESFDSDSGAFAYADNSFGGSAGANADGSWASGALRVDLGGGSNTTVTVMSGGWTTSFTLDTESEVSLSFLYELTQSAQYEADEYSQVLVSIDGGAPILVASLTGDGNGGGAQTTGLQTFNAMIGVLAAGDHSLTIGAFNNKKTWSDEFTGLTIDDVTATATPTTPPEPIDTSYAIAAADAVLSEGDAGTTIFTFTVTRSGDLVQNGNVDFTVVGAGATAADADDFLGGLLPGGSVFFDTPGVGEATISIEVVGDTDFEADEGFMVVLSNPAAGGEITVASAAGTILNDDPEPSGPVILVEADFNASGETGGFAYSDGVFGGGASQASADGSWSDGALSIDLGAGSNSVVTDMSGAWEIDFSLAAEMDVSLSFNYELLISTQYEPDEYSQLLVSIDGGAPITVDELFGDGNGGPDQTTGLQAAVLDLGSLAAGDHSLAIGGYNSKKTWSDEFTEITIDDVQVTGTVTTGASDAPAASLVAGGGAEAQPLGLSETELLSSAGF